MTANGHTLYCGTVGDCISINEQYIDFATTLPPEYAACFLNPGTQPDSLKCVPFCGNKKMSLILNHLEGMRYYECYHHRQLQQIVWESQLWVQEPIFLPHTLISCHTLFQQFKNFKCFSEYPSAKEINTNISSNPCLLSTVAYSQFKV